MGVEPVALTTDFRIYSSGRCKDTITPPVGGTWITKPGGERNKSKRYLDYYRAQYENR